MPKPRDRVRKILDWEELERAPNTHGALSFLKSAAEIVSIRKNDDLKTLAPSNPTPGVRKLSATKHRPNPKPCFLAQDGHSLGDGFGQAEGRLEQPASVRRCSETPDGRHEPLGALWLFEDDQANQGFEACCVRTNAMFAWSCAVSTVGKPISSSSGTRRVGWKARH